MIELEGESHISAAYGHAAIEKISYRNNGSLTIQDEDNDGKLVVQGGKNGAGIGGGYNGDGSNITISGGTVHAQGGDQGAGIGGGRSGNGSNITVSDGTVNASGTIGIGGSYLDPAATFGIDISGGTVTASGNKRAIG